MDKGWEFHTDYSNEIWPRKRKKKETKGKQKEKEKRRGMVKCLRLTDKEKSKTFLISLGCVTVPMVLISRTLSSCKSAFLNSCIMASSVLASQFLRTVLYTADLKSAGIVASPLQWASNLLWASVIVAEWPLRPRTPRTIPRKRASRWPKRTFRRKFCPKVVRTFPENCRINCFDVSETSWRDYHGIELVFISFHSVIMMSWGLRNVGILSR